jgi:hypothetical protein
VIDGAEYGIAHRPSEWAVEHEGGPQLGLKPADALTAASGRQHQPLELSPHFIGVAVRQHERDAPGRFEASVGSGPRQQQALRASALGRRPAAHKKLLGAPVLVLDPGPVSRAGQVWAAQPLGDDPLQAVLAGRGRHPRLSRR